jgi:hypothetical protein
VSTKMPRLNGQVQPCGFGSLEPHTPWLRVYPISSAGASILGLLPMPRVGTPGIETHPACSIEDRWERLSLSDVALCIAP